MKGKLKLPTNDEECRALLRDVCGRTEEQIDAIFEFAKLSKEIENGVQLREGEEKMKPQSRAPYICPLCGKSCWGKRGCRDCWKKGKYGTLTRYYGYHKELKK